MAVEKISVTIITLDEEEHIRECLESVKWADEVIVTDSGSRDNTVEICRAFGAKVYSDEWQGYGIQKNLCAGRASNDLILNIDADERVTPELRDEIFEAVKPDIAGYYIPRKNFFGGRWIRRCGWYPDYNMRLYRKERGRFTERLVHESVRVDGPCGYLKNPIVHLTYNGISDYLERMERYSTLAARQMLDEGKGSGIVNLALRPPYTFFKMFFLKGGVLEGADGFILSGLYSCYTFAKYAKLRELRRGGDNEQ